MGGKRERHMTIDRIFILYMALIGVAAGALLVALPQAQDFWLKPYFWILIAVLVFDLGTMLMRRGRPGAALTMNARVIGFILGGILMVAFPTIAGVEVRFF
jgi:hypothetical protein